ncbi:MAG: hypothetical protein IT169_20020 [Bryobacterales bacterium]|nr:hypothetical protein [Bryobacterales bacterium]
MRPSLLQIVLICAAFLVLCAVVLSLSQPAISRGRFEFDIRQDFEGIYREKPIPALWVLRRQDPGAFANYSIYPLVAPGFHGLSQMSRRFDGVPVTLSGKLIYNGTLTSIEVDEASIQRIQRIVEFPEPSPPRELGEAVLRGEILDLKSYAGYQEPGSGSWVIAPASNAIRGGIPPVLVMRDAHGNERAALLLNPNGDSLGQEALGHIGTAIEVRGELGGIGGLLTLKTKPENMRRLLPWE